MTKPKIAVLGLGIMGHGIADNFIKNGYEVTLWNRSKNKAEDLIENGATFTESIKDAVQSADMIFEVTANDQSANSIWLDAGGIIENANPSQYLITCATLSVDFTKQLNDICISEGLTFFDMPMTGGSIGAQTGQLTLLVGGDQEKLNIIEPDLKAIAKDVKYFGPTGSGMKYKLILNAVQAVHITMFGEALRLAEAAGLDKKVVGDALVDRPGGISTTIARDSFIAEPENVSFSVAWIAIDLDYAVTMVEDVETPYLDVVLDKYVTAVKQGLGDCDWTVLNKS